MKRGSLTEKYHFKSLHEQIMTIETAAKEMKRLSGGMQAIDTNADSILAFVHLLHQNVSDVVELDTVEV